MKKPREKCSTPLCRNLKGRRSNGRSAGARCWKCRMRAFREGNRIAAAYFTQRDHARERGIEWNVPRVTFECLVRITGLLDNGPRNHAGGLTIDRINADRTAAPFYGAYTPGNLQVMTREANASKRWEADGIRQRHGYSWATIEELPEEAYA